MGLSRRACWSCRAAAIYLGVRYRRFAFVAYGTLYGYAGVSVRLLDAMGGLIARADLFRRHRIDRRDAARRAGATDSGVTNDDLSARRRTGDPGAADGR